MRLHYVFCTASLALLTGCAGLAQALQEANAMQSGRNYVTNPVTLPPAPTTTQPSFGTSPSEQYQTILVNTPNGLVYKRCKVLNGQAVACF